MFKKIVKRDGRIVDFDSSKITNAIYKAGQATGEFGLDIAKRLTIKVLDLAIEVIKDKIPTVEEIQDIVEEVLLNSPYKKTAKAYIIYREQHAKIREITTKANLDLINQYLNHIDWRVKENSNMSFSLQGLNNYVSSEIVKTYWLNSIYPPEVRKAYIDGDFHIHDLGSLSVYCVGWDLYDLLITGFRGASGKVESSPARHFRSALGQIVNFFYSLQGEAAGAQAFSNFDTLLAPFVKYDGLSYKEVKQCIQEFLFNLNVPTRVGFQTPFTNLTFDLVVSPVYKDQPVVIGGEFQNKTYGEYQEEMNMINKAFFEVMQKGDAKGRVFSVSGDSVCLIKNSGKIKLTEIGEYIDKLMEKRNPIFIKENNCQVLDVRDSNIMTLGIKEGEVVWQKVNFLVRHPVNELLRIWTVGGFNIKVTTSHSVFILKEGKIQSWKASELKVGDYLVSPRIIMESSEKENFEISLAEEFLKQGKEEDIYIRNVKKKNGKTLWQKRISKKSIYYSSVFPLVFIKENLKGLDLSEAKLCLKGSKFKISNTLKISNELIEFLGWYLAEGSAEKNKKCGGISLGFNLKKEKDRVFYIANLIKKIWPEIPLRIREIEKRNLIEIRIHSKLIRKIITDIFGIGNKKEKKVPDFIFELSSEKKKVFLNAYFGGDAYIKGKKIVTTSISSKLIYGISTLLKQLDVFHTLTEYRVNGKMRWRVNIIGNTDLNPHRSYTISKIPIRESGLIQIVEKILEKEPYFYDSLGRKYKNTKNRIFVKLGISIRNTKSTNLKNVEKVIRYAEKLGIEIPLTLREIEKGKILFLQIKKIESLKVEKNMVYDFSTENENFIANQLLVHNTFPIPTYNITKNFDWDNEILDGLWEMTGKYGIPYFANFINSDMKPEDVRSMCCRLRLDTRDLRKKGGGLFGANPLTGSIGVVTINLPRIGYLSKSKEEFKSRLNDLLYIARESLEIKRKVIERLTEENLYPYSKFYLRNVKERFGKYWVNHFSTIGIIGMNEACLNLFGKDIGTEEGIEFAKEIMYFIREKLEKFQEETGNIYNLEATPAEGTSYRLAKLDKNKFPDIIVANEEEYRKGAEPFYTNSTHLPVNYTDDIFEVLEKQDELQTLYTGGTVIHLFVGEKIDSKEGIKKLVRTICKNFKLPYFTITPTFSICPNDGYISGEHFTCPKCKSVTEVYSRIVGYLRPVSQWNKGKYEEFKMRKTFVLK